MNTDIVHSIIKDAFHEMVAGIQKQPKTGLSPAQKRAKRIASEASMQSAGQGSGVSTKEGSRKKSKIAREVASAAATTSGAKATTKAGRSIQRQEKLRTQLQSPDYRKKVQDAARASNRTYDNYVRELKATAKDPAKYRKISDQVSSASGGKQTTAERLAPINNPKVLKPIISKPPKPPKKAGPGGKLQGANLSSYERATGNVRGGDRASKYLKTLLRPSVKKALTTWARKVLYA